MKQRVAGADLGTMWLHLPATDLGFSRTVETFANPPIQEALVDIRAKVAGSVSLATLKGYGDELNARFPERQERIKVVQGFQISTAGENQSVSSARTVDGYLFTSKEEGKTVQARLDGFTFNKLKPYSKWDEFSGEAKELWQRYAALAKPTSVERLGLRYINRIPIPSDLRDLRDLCVLFPDIPPRIPQALAEYFQRFVAPVEDGLMAIVTLALDAGMEASHPSVILDIDVSWVLKIEQPEVDALWARLDRMRTIKNEVFDASLTPATKATFR